MTSDAPLPTRLAAAPKGRWRDRLIVGGLVALLAAGLIGLASATGWHEIGVQIARLGPVQIAALLSLSLLNYALRAARWHLFAHRLGLPTGALQNARHYLGGFAMSVTPGRVGELVRMRWIRAETGWAFERTAPLALVDRAADLASMALILMLAVALSATGMTGAWPVAAISLLAAAVATRPGLLALAATWGHRALGRFPRLFVRVRSAARSLDRFSHGPVLATALGLGILGWAAEAYAFHLLLVWLGADVPLWRAVAIFVFATLAGGLTGAPGGLGGAEAAMIALLALDGVPMEISVPATAIIRVTTLWFAILIGLAVFPLAERLSRKGRNALENR